MTPTEAKLGRRRFSLLVALTLVGLIAGGIAIAWRRHLRRAGNRLWDLVQNPARRIHDHYPYLDLDVDGVVAYVRDYDRIARLPRFGEWPERVYARYLLSTDFFQNGADESRRVRYVSLYHPFAAVCNNPLARPE